MQSVSQAQRVYSQRRAEDSAPQLPNGQSRPMSPNGVPSRASTASVKSSQSGSTRRSGRETGSSSSSVPLSQIEKSVTHLLVATKQLLETLTQWSRGHATDTQVSDVYVRLGYEFNMACRAFTAINVDTSDLGNVPDLLRSILEATLSQEASAESLERYLPRIRDIIINLLHGLKRKQQRLRQRQARDRDPTANAPERTTSISTVTSGSSSGLTNMLDEGLESGYKQEQSRLEEPASQGPSSSPSRRVNASREPSRDFPQLARTSTQNAPSIPPPYPNDDSQMPSGTTGDINIEAFPPPPPPPPEPQSSALAALQKGGDLERRASRRYSQYQISKHLGAANAVPILPHQNSPVPNRGRKEARESLHAVQKRESVRHSRHQSSHSKSVPSPAPAIITEELSADNRNRVDSPLAQTPENKYAPSATLSGPLPEPPYFVDEPRRAEPETKAVEKIEQIPTAPESKGDSYYQVSPPPTPTKDLTLFLQYKSKVKKIVLPEGRSELSIGRLQLAFIEKFSWNTQHNGTDLPEIYIQDPVSGIRHELEDLSDVKDRTVLVLNIEALDEVKRHIDDGISGLTKIVQDVQNNVQSQAATLQRVSDRQQETAEEVARLAFAPPVAVQSADGSKAIVSTGPRLGASHLGQIQTFRRDIAVLRQTYSNFQASMDASIATVRQKAASVTSVAASAVQPDMDGDGGYSYVTKGRKKLNADSDRLVGKVDDLQDLIEDLRKDVVHRGVKPLPRQLETVNNDISELTKALKAMEDYMTEEKPVWTKIWEKELEDVCQGRDELRLMEDLMVDLRDDLEKATETFALVEQAMKEQMKDNGAGANAGTSRMLSRGLSNLGNSLNQNAAKEGVLGEVRALQPNHENRLDAIERAEKLRQKELLSRSGNELQREIASFVHDGKLKKSGGFEEVERARVAKDEKIRREVWERMNGIINEDDYEEEEEEEEEEGEEGEEGEEFEDAETEVTSPMEGEAQRHSGGSAAGAATNKE
ncbi:actin interacting protein 3 [Cordyceps fumosorosea ARSEF 2679]|uniref:Actin interacting protein 3 n=1 Tax=Cordyceps fumosorosea (strain ARSEF 2679) TaxID=1081104 RepID=A0A162MS99_CORFA|nr:actin interacting protein 3 [Cordyceps fumosorosea ARSEF 2679]OAA69459.1 actin interacting protein 3 [Cordyceps fumosorosea ARSEF 2679]